MLLRVACTIVTTSYNLHFLITVLGYSQEYTWGVEGKYFTIEASRGCYEHQLCAKPAKWGLEVKNSASTHRQDRKGGRSTTCAVVSTSCSSAVWGYCLIVAIPMGSIIGLATTLLSENRGPILFYQIEVKACWSKILFLFSFLQLFCKGRITAFELTIDSSAGIACAPALEQTSKALSSWVHQQACY